MAESELGSYGSISSSESQPSGPTLSSIDEISTKEQLKICCKTSYKMRRVKTKGAILVLVWNLLVITTFWYISSTSFRGHVHNDNGSTISAVAFGFTLPLAGWLADACVGRYRMIYCSVLITWAATVLGTLSAVIEVPPMLQ